LTIHSFIHTTQERGRTMDTQLCGSTLSVAEGVELQQGDAIAAIFWRWVNAEQATDPDRGWIEFSLHGSFVARQLYHLISVAYDNGARPVRQKIQFHANARAGLEFKVCMARGTSFLIISADAVRSIFRASRMPPVSSGSTLVRRPRLPVGLPDAMRCQSDRQVALETAML